MALFPTPTRAEAALLDEYDARLREATEGPRHRRHGEGELDAPAGADPGDSQAEGDDPPAGR